MATFKEVVLTQNRSSNGPWKVKIRVTHKRRSAYMDTPYRVSRRQLNADLTIRDNFILKKILTDIEGYQEKMNKLGRQADYYSVHELLECFIVKEEISADTINVIEFGDKRIAELRKLKRDGSAGNMATVVYALRDFFESDFVPVTAIRAKVLKNYEEFLKRPRTITRPNRGRLLETKVKGLTENGLHCHFRDLRILFNDICEHYNDEDAGEMVITHNPFKKFKVRKSKPRRKDKLTLAQFRAIRDLELKPGSRIEQARDLFLLSFYLCGMNAVDLYKIVVQEGMERVAYNRSKTMGRRSDEAFISIKLIAPARALLVKYSASIRRRYGSHLNLDRALSYGMRKIGAMLEFNKLEFYDARHFFADQARNGCRFSKDDVGLALNHTDQSNAVTDLYLSKNWDIIDEIQEAVVARVNAG